MLRKSTGIKNIFFLSRNYHFYVESQKKFRFSHPASNKEWIHTTVAVHGTNDDEGFSVYLNGASAGSATTLIPSHYNHTIQPRINLGHRKAAVGLDDLIIWMKELTDRQIYYLFTSYWGCWNSAGGASGQWCLFPDECRAWNHPCTFSVLGTYATLFCSYLGGSKHLLQEKLWDIQQGKRNRFFKISFRKVCFLGYLFWERHTFRF